MIVDVPDIPSEELADVMEWIKAEVTLLKNSFCWKDSYGRGFETTPNP
jgi:hypothetical protein